MWNSRLDEAQAGIKTAGRNINNLRYAHEICTLMAESKEGLKNLLMKVKESEKAGLKLNIKTNWDHGIWTYQFMANRRGKVETVTDFIFLGSKITVDDDCSHEYLLLGKKALTNQDSVLKSRNILCWERSI